MSQLLPAPTILELPPRHFWGLVRRYTQQTRAAISTQWRDYGAVAGLSSGPFYGISFHYDAATGGFDYLTGQEGQPRADRPDFGAVVVEGRHACFASSAPITSMPSLFDAAYGAGLQGYAMQVRAGPAVEYYPATFDPKTGLGGFEIWVPVAP